MWVSSWPVPKNPWTVVRLLVPLTHSLVTRKRNAAASGAARTASTVAKSVAVSTPLRIGPSVMVISCSLWDSPRVRGGRPVGGRWSDRGSTGFSGPPLVAAGHRSRGRPGEGRWWDHGSQGRRTRDEPGRTDPHRSARRLRGHDRRPLRSGRRLAQTARRRARQAARAPTRASAPPRAGPRPDLAG